MVAGGTSMNPLESVRPEESGLSERNHSLPSALKQEADFLNRRFQGFADDLTRAATELEDLRNEVSLLRAGILRAIRNEDERLTVLLELRDSTGHHNHDGLIG